MRKIYTFSQELCNKMIEMHSKGLLNKEIAANFNCSPSTINRQLSKLGVISRHPRLSNEREQKAIEMYKKFKNIQNVADIVCMSPTTVKNILVKNNIHVRSMSEIKSYKKINESYFDSIDSHRKAYYLGLLFADGCVSSKGNTMRVSLQETDRHILEQLKNDLETDYKLSFIDYNSKNSHWKNQYSLSITNKHIHDTLISHGMIPRKSLLVEYPRDLLEKYYSSFILGYFDGNGTIQKSECKCSFVSTESFCNSVKYIVEKQLNIHCSIRYAHNKKVSTRSLVISGRNQVKKFLDWIYSESDIYLYRKYELYKCIYYNK